MLLRIFKTSQPLSWIFIIVLLVVLRGILFFTFFNDTHLPENVSFTGHLCTWMATISTVLSHLLSLIIILPSGFFFNKIAQNANLFKGIHYLLLLFFTLFLSYSPANLILTPFIISVPILLFSLAMILSQTKGKPSLATIFNASFLIGIATAIYTPNILLFAVLFISLFYLSKVTWRSVFVAFIGVTIPWLIQDVMAFTFNQPQYYTQPVFAYYLPFAAINHLAPIKTSFAIVLLLFAQLPVYYISSSKSIIKIRKALFILLYYLILGLVLSVFVQADFGQWINIIILPISVVFTLFQLEVKKWWLGDFTLLLLITCLAMNYLYI